MLFQFILAFSLFVLFMVILWRAVGKATVNKIVPREKLGAAFRLRARIRQLEARKVKLRRKQTELAALKEQVESAKKEIGVSAELAETEKELARLIRKLNGLDEAPESF